MPGAGRSRERVGASPRSSGGRGGRAGLYGAPVVASGWGRLLDPVVLGGRASCAVDRIASGARRRVGVTFGVRTVGTQSPWSEPKGVQLALALLLLAGSVWWRYRPSHPGCATSGRRRSIAPRPTGWFIGHPPSRRVQLAPPPMSIPYGHRNSAQCLGHELAAALLSSKSAKGVGCVVASLLVSPAPRAGRPPAPTGDACRAPPSLCRREGLGPDFRLRRRVIGSPNRRGAQPGTVVTAEPASRTDAPTHLSGWSLHIWCVDRSRSHPSLYSDPERPDRQSSSAGVIRKWIARSPDPMQMHTPV